MLAYRLLPFFVFALSSLAGQALSPDESKLIGTWQFTTMDAVGRETYTRDHRYTLSFAEDDIGHPGHFGVAAIGTWRLEGSYLITESDDNVVPDRYPLSKPHPPKKRVDRLRVLQFRKNEIVFERAASLHRVK